MHTFSFVLLFYFGTLNVRAQEAAKDKPLDLPGYLEVTSRIGTGGQPTGAGFRLLAEKEYRAVINLRTADEGVDLAAEAKTASDLGLKYYNIPVVGKDPHREQVEDFMKLMEDLKQEKVFVHCTTANRVGSFMLIYRVLRDGIAREQAEEEARRIGLRSEILLKFARDFISRP
jgi:protein tyrosine phosphatase (PTP) superfamily phosphohydrolase (DUF442 family)